MFTLSRASFRQLLLVAFLLIAALLGAASVSGLFTLERLIGQAREGAELAVQLSAQTQALAEQSVTMERAARQYVVLDDTALRQRFEGAAGEAESVLQRLVAQRVPAERAAEWHARLDGIRELMQGPRTTAADRERALSLAFRELDETQAAIATDVRRSNEAHNRALQDELEAGRLRLGRQVLGAVALAVVLALAFGWWLARPLKRVERAIVGLGANRLEQPIEIRGPADVRSIGRRLDWLRLQLAELDADKARFLRHVSHELKTPLAALREGVSLLEDGITGPLSDSQREVARILRQNTVTLQRQIEDLLSFNAAAFEARRLQRRRVELTGWVRELVADQQLQWQARQLNVEIEGRPVHAEIDPDKLGMAVRNLLSNAIRFSPVGATIRFSLSRQAAQVCIDLTDEGPGIAERDRARIFEPFYRGERQPEGGLRGSGIGLSIVQEYVAAHGGRVELLPPGPASPARGAHFRIHLPHAS